MSIEQRWQAHLKASKGKSRCAFHKALRKYSVVDWKHEILDVLFTISAVKHAEKLWIRESKSYDTGYNQTLGGDGRQGYVTSNETKLLIRSKLRGRCMPDDQREKLSRALTGKRKSKLHVINHANAISKPIAKCDMQHRVIEVFPSLTIAAKSFSNSSAGSRIHEALQKKRRKTYKGYVWNYVEKK